MLRTSSPGELKVPCPEGPAYSSHLEAPIPISTASREWAVADLVADRLQPLAGTDNEKRHLLELYETARNTGLAPGISSDGDDDA